MFGIGFRSAVKSVLDQNFEYHPVSFQVHILKQVCSSAKAHGANEYDAAVMFMLSQMNALYSSDNDSQEFIKKHVNNIRRIYNKCKGSSDDIEALIAVVLKNHGMACSKESA